MLARYRDAARMDHIGFDPMRAQPPRQPEAVTASLERDHHAVDRLAGLARLVTPAMQQRQQGFGVRTLLLQGLAGNAGNQPSNQPSLATQFDHRNKRAILIEGDEGPAQIIPLHGALHRCVDSNDGATPRRLPHRISPRVRGEVDLRAERKRSDASRVRGRFR